MKKLKIGITCYPSVGGSGIVATLLGIELARRGHRVHFVSYERPFRLPLKSKNIFFHQVQINSYQLFRYPDYTLPLTVTMASVQARYRLDIMHVHYAVPHATAALLARQIIMDQHDQAFRVITTLHGTDITLVGRDPSLAPVIRYSIEQSCGITAVSKNLAQETKNIFGVKNPIEVIYNFYTPKKITKSAAVVRRQLGVASTDFLISHASNLRSVKRIPDLLKIIARLKNKYPVKLLVIAGDNFKPYQPMVNQLGIANHVVVKQDVADIENYFNASDCGVYTSDHESFGMSILETMSYGRAILATRAGGVPEIINNGKTGLLYNVGDVNGFACGIERLIVDPTFRHKIATAGQHRALIDFSTQAMVDRYVVYYQKVLSRKS